MQQKNQFFNLLYKVVSAPTTSSESWAGTGPDTIQHGGMSVGLGIGPPALHPAGADLSKIEHPRANVEPEGSQAGLGGLVAPRCEGVQRCHV